MIETPRLVLRNWREEDIAPFVRHTNTPAVMRWLGGVAAEDAAAAAIRERLMRWQDVHGCTFWVVERKQDQALLGFCGIKVTDAPNCPTNGQHEIGWRLREDAWGQGYAGEAARASFDHAFTRLAIERVFAFTCNQNEASWGLMVRLGMRRRPEFDYEDPRFPDLNPTIAYGMEAQAWQPA